MMAIVPKTNNAETITVLRQGINQRQKSASS